MTADDYRCGEISARSAAALAAPWSRGLNPDMLFAPTAPRLPVRLSAEDCRYGDHTIASVLRFADLDFIAAGRNFVVEALKAIAAGKPVPSGEYHRMRQLLTEASLGDWRANYADPSHSRAAIVARRKVATGEGGVLQSQLTTVCELFRRDGDSIQPEAELIVHLKDDVTFLLATLAPYQTVEVDGFIVDWEDVAEARRFGPWEPCPTEEGRAWNEATGAFLDALLLPHDPLDAEVSYWNGDRRDLRRCNIRLDDALEPVVLRFPPKLRSDFLAAVKDGGHPSAEALVLAKCF